MQLLTSDRIFSAVNYRIKWHRLYVSTFVYFQRALNSLDIRCLSTRNSYCIKTIYVNPFDPWKWNSIWPGMKEYKIFNMAHLVFSNDSIKSCNYRLLPIITRRRKQTRNINSQAFFFLFLTRIIIPSNRRIQNQRLPSILSSPLPPLPLPLRFHIRPFPSVCFFFPSSSPLFLYLSELENTLLEDR